MKQQHGLQLQRDLGGGTVSSNVGDPLSGQRSATWSLGKTSQLQNEGHSPLLPPQAPARGDVTRLKAVAALIR